jgi:hypothetical protein
VGAVDRRPRGVPQRRAGGPAAAPSPRGRASGALVTAHAGGFGGLPPAPRRGRQTACRGRRRPCRADRRGPLVERRPDGRRRGRRVVRRRAGGSAQTPVAVPLPRSVPPPPDDPRLRREAGVGRPRPAAGRRRAARCRPCGTRPPRPVDRLRRGRRRVGPP